LVGEHSVGLEQETAGGGVGAHLKIGVPTVMEVGTDSKRPRWGGRLGGGGGGAFEPEGTNGAEGGEAFQVDRRVEQAIGTDSIPGPGAVEIDRAHPASHQFFAGHAQVGVGLAAPDYQSGGLAVVELKIQGELASGLDTQRLEVKLGGRRVPGANDLDLPVRLRTAEDPKIAAEAPNLQPGDHTVDRQPLDVDADVLNLVGNFARTVADVIGPGLALPNASELAGTRRLVLGCSP
jgi:hypothetical protein